MLGVRAKSIANELSRSARGTSLPFSLRTAHLNSLDRRMRQLQGRWQRRLEIEAKECEYAERTKNLDAISTYSPKNQDDSSIAPHPGNQDTFTSRVPSQAHSLPIRSPAPLSEFEATVGELMVQARTACPGKYLPQTEILRIAVLLDERQFPVRSNLERAAARIMAEYNKQHPASAIKSWRAALRLPQFRRTVRKRFSRAEEKYKKTTPSVVAPSAGTPRTTI